jgi:hypothetical protein
VPGASTRWERFDLPTVWDKPAPAPALDGLTDVTAPAATPAGKVLGTTATGTWAPVDPPQGDLTPVTDRIAAVEAVVDPGGSAQPWNATTAYQPGSVVSHGGGLFVAAGQVSGGTGPAAPLWRPLSLAETAMASEGLMWATTGIIGASGLPEPWMAKAYPAGALVVKHTGSAYEMFHATGPAAAGDVPGTAAVWERVTLPALRDRIAAIGTPTGVWKSWSGTQAQFDALPTKDPATLYVVTG